MIRAIALLQLASPSHSTGSQVGEAPSAPKKHELESEQSLVHLTVGATNTAGVKSTSRHAVCADKGFDLLGITGQCKPEANTCFERNEQEGECDNLLLMVHRIMFFWLRSSVKEFRWYLHRGH